MVCLRPPETLPLVMNLESIPEWHLFQGLRREKLPASKVSANLNFERERQPELWKMGRPPLSPSGQALRAQELKLTSSKRAVCFPFD